MDAAEDPDPDGWPVHPAAAFYGLWPRFAAEDAEGADDPVAADSTAGLTQ
ncbi:hypothetical protein [Longimicrobium sp.]